ncbi:MAG TPA: HipA domain-containing protein [Acidimicrobiales bacterium]|nr:HipA domain-containing protein [Acidimicrobiales bacterium]
MAEELAVWLYGTRVATIDSERGRPRLTYTAEARALYSPGTPLLSLSLPVRAERFPQGVVRPFLDGLLPEGDSRRVIARDVGVDADDTYGLVRELGRDCAGAIVIKPIEEGAPPRSTTRTAERLSSEEIDDLVRNLRSAPLGAGGRVRISLAGVQEKLLLTLTPDGTWGRPVDGTPSTHILKPEIAAYPDTVENEAFCMRIATHLGLPAADVETTEVSGRKLIVVQRYDRLVQPDGAVERIHQEDFCQATGTRPDDKYQEDGGPSLLRIADIVAAVTAPGSLEHLLRAVTLNTLVGNGDAHAKNFSLLHERSGVLHLAPLYDVMCTLAYDDDRLAMYVDDVRRTNRVTFGRLVNEGASWGLPRRRCEQIVTDLLDRAPAAIKASRADTAGIPDWIVDVVEGQLAQLRGG